MEIEEGNGLARQGEALVKKVLNAGIDGIGPFKGAVEVAEESLKRSNGDVEMAIEHVARVHLRLASTNGAVTGLGGLLTLPVTVPVGIGGYYLLGARMAAAVAHIRGHDVHSEDVRTAVLLVMLGDAAKEVLKDLGIQVGRKSLSEALKRVPGRIYIEINKKVGYRLITKAGQKGLINVAKLVPLIGAPIGATFEYFAMRTVVGYARRSFPLVQPGERPSV